MHFHCRDPLRGAVRVTIVIDSGAIRNPQMRSVSKIVLNGVFWVVTPCGSCKIVLF
jgi:hypothetical protein